MQTSAISNRTPAASEQAEIRLCRDLDELQACVDLQKEVWGFADTDLIPIRMFVVAQKIGGQVIGGFRGGELIAFALAIPGTRNNRPYLHSHMLAVRERYRNSGIGRRIKLAQREEALKAGIELMEWTFDPLEIKNAYLNLHKLGAIARRYTINQYGISSSPLQGGLPTDRLIAEWWLRSRRVVELIEHGKPPQVEPELAIEVPAQVYEWKSKAPTRARAAEVHSRNRELFLSAFARGLAALEYERDAEGNGRFLLGRWEETWSYGT